LPKAIVSPSKETCAGKRPANHPFTFIDLFSGIGGFHIGLAELGGKCVLACDRDAQARKTYKEWFRLEPLQDITKLTVGEIPDHDVLAAGFPCQPFSIAGVSKKNSLGRAHGFSDPTQGNLFFFVLEIIKGKRPPIAILENVKNLKSHDKGNTWRVIRESLKAADYSVSMEVVDASGWVPQHRERVFIVCLDTRRFGSSPAFVFPARPESRPQFRTILEPKPDPKYTLSDNLWTYLQGYAERHRAKGNGFGFGMTALNGVSRTLSARYYKDGSEVLIPQPRRNPRRLTPREAARLMGFPDSFPIVVSDTQAYRQFGNAVVPAVVSAVARPAVELLCGRRPKAAGSRANGSASVRAR
jgi:DNA (cytosine-5)-methyltransferase 1